ncbi:pyruvate kinase [Carboxydochorda subterranea]|uniref:Pyruvate kinase n=1 Tax=Carboxydichorda subterranea TaxID=3109565 RepID=A0ABZ1BUE1_9FIRM|nr:pyruvate kinase [Limnochorda sp. L945t]WRP16304.1 pyruvate kinase [Limnochorda sp. L945t]
MPPFRHTKLVCTIGPASEDETVVTAMLDAGMDVARLNLSHGTLDEHARRLERLRRLSAQRLRPLAVMLDIQGPKIRLGEFEAPRTLRKGERLVLQGVETPSSPADPGAIPVVYPGLARSVRPGGLIYLDDGVVRLTVEAVEGERVTCVAQTSGSLRSRKGVALPGVRVDLPALTETDRRHLEWAAEMGVDMVAASFVRRGAHVEAVREALAKAGAEHVPVIAKIESAEGLDNLDEIVAAADGVMVARGDLGVDISLEEVPVAQKAIIRRCNAAGKPVITATQMLESMVHSPTPTRAEVTDVANAILDGTDAVMLSGETAVGEYPVEAVGMLHRIALSAEQALDDHKAVVAPGATVAPERPGKVARAISRAACHIAAEVGATAILCSTQSGATARMVASFRPRAPIIAATPRPEVARQLAVVWGVFPVVVPRARTIDEMLDLAITAALRTGYVRRGDRVAVAAGVKTDMPGSTNLIQVHEVP